MPFPMKIQPIDFQSLEEPTRFEPVKPVVKSRLKRLFERQFLRNSAAEKVGAIEEPLHHFNKDGGSTEFEPSSLCLAKMVQNFMEESNEKQSGAVKCGRNRCNCFNGHSNDSSEDELDSYFGDSTLSSSGEALEILKSLVPCASVSERNLLADTAKIVEKNKISKHKDDICRKIVSDGLLALGYDTCICKSHWDKTPSYPAGDYEYIDVVIEGQRLIIDIDFRSEFEIARSTKTFKSILQALPYIFVGKADRLQKIIAIVSEAAKQSLKKKGMHIPPWRKADYIKAKWLSPHARAPPSHESDPKTENNKPLSQSDSEFELNNSVDGGEGGGEPVFVLSESSEEDDKKKKVVKDWKAPQVKPKSLQIGARVVTGLASVIEDHRP
ncbi:hypothetical protein LWI28_014626 [Acer negundo]|uniref:Uncharacterized protein n=1 Tax=Acer negundo TaxID=4023 RepID=A0AAD5J087_ACENE|nr:hypothetical protein LWI28_014626 [Acer negundo]KAK4847444.1 hypothetical protein QYF36_001979 [Acer negundo]